MRHAWVRTAVPREQRCVRCDAVRIRSRSTTGRTYFKAGVQLGPFAPACVGPLEPPAVDALSGTEET